MTEQSVKALGLSHIEFLKDNPEKLEMIVNRLKKKKSRHEQLNIAYFELLEHLKKAKLLLDGE